VSAAVLAAITRACDGKKPASVLFVGFFPVLRRRPKPNDNGANRNEDSISATSRNQNNLTLPEIIITCFVASRSGSVAFGTVFLHPARQLFLLPGLPAVGRQKP
jgi:hypothetical protein